MRKLVIIIVLLCWTAVAGVGQQRWGVVDVSAAILQGRSDYESAVETQLLMGSVVEVLEREGYWVKVRSVYPAYEAWTTELTLAMMDEAEKKDYAEAEKYIFTANYSHIMDRPSKEAGQICDALMGGMVRVMKDVEGRPVRKGNWLGVVMPSGREGYVDKNDVDVFSKWEKERKATPERVVEEAMKYLGVPYMWGGNTIEHVDCSGLTMGVYFMCGILLPRNASQQVKCGIEVQVGEMQAGDLVFYGKEAEDGKPEKISHVAIYLGEGKIIHASEKVRICSLEEGHPDSYTRKILHVRRIIGQSERKVSSVFQNN